MNKRFEGNNGKRENNNNNNSLCLYSLLPKNKITTMKILKVKLEYWLPGMTIEASRASIK